MPQPLSDIHKQGRVKRSLPDIGTVAQEVLEGDTCSL